jgi:hypothetical protein
LDVGEDDLFPDGARIPHDDRSLFVGTWTCQSIAAFTPNGASGPEVSLAETELAIFVANPDGTLTLTLDTVTIKSVSIDAGNYNGGPVALVVSGSTPTAIAGPLGAYTETFRTDVPDAGDDASP